MFHRKLLSHHAVSKFLSRNQCTCSVSQFLFTKCPMFIQCPDLPFFDVLLFVYPNSFVQCPTIIICVFPSFNYPVVFSVSSTFFFHLSILNIFSFSVPMSMSMFISYYHVFILPQLPSVSYSHTTFHCYPFNVPLFRPSRSSLTSKRRAQSTKMTGDGHQIT